MQAQRQFLSLQNMSPLMALFELIEKANLYSSGNYTEAAILAANSPHVRIPSLNHFSNNSFLLCVITGRADSNDSCLLRLPFSNKTVKYCSNSNSLSEETLTITFKRSIVLYPLQWNLVIMFDLTLVLSIYLRANISIKGKKVGFQPDYSSLLQKIMRMNPDKGEELATALTNDENGPLVDIEKALELYDDVNDIKRIITHAHALPPNFIVSYFGNLSVDNSLDCLKEMLKANIRQNLQIVIQIATKYSEQLRPSNLIQLFESLKSCENLYYYLGSIVNISTDPDVHFKYIQATVKTEQNKEEVKLQDQLPLIIVCDRFDYVHDLVLYLYQQNLTKYIEVYVQKINSARTPAVVGGLLDVDCDENTIKNLLMSVTGTVLIINLFKKLKKEIVLNCYYHGWSYMLKKEIKILNFYNALAKIRIDNNVDPEKFLREDTHYDSMVVGKYCEKRDSHLAFVAYQRGQCDFELVRVTNENIMFKHQARYLVKRRNPQLWAHVLDGNNMHRTSLTEQVNAVVLSETTDPEDVSATLMGLLEKLIFENTTFNDQKTLQILLILTAIKADKTKVMSFVNKLNNFDTPEAADIAIKTSLYEEAFAIYKKCNEHINAINMLVEHIASLDRAAKFAEKCDIIEVWSRLAKAQITDPYIHADDPSNFLEIISIVSQTEKYEDLELLNIPNVAQIQIIGERCYEDDLYESNELKVDPGVYTLLVVKVVIIKSSYLL
ncbi:541_t:CDS:10 [Entrophospora sp. SA101]|nr:541_t:CDS:10 [Entrophospora sp. SA101]